MSVPDPTDTRRRAERWDRLADLFEQATALPLEHQKSFLDARCGDDPALRDELERMLREREPASFLEPPRASPRTPPSLFRPDSLVGKRIGAYRVLRAIATGGMGTVYEAEQERPHRRVALKVMLAGRASGTARRFRYEAEILARLKHPGIAQVYEAGIHVDASDGDPVEIPWFAMEHVEGARTILEHARERDLDLGARLALVLEVCAAVGYGHEKGVIHRDLKPSNLLVDAAGRVKVIDYGVARARGPEETAETLVTRTGELVGTLQYMSPEQIEGDVEQLDVRSDVYAIGLVLYELLCGEPPYDLAGLPLSAIARKIRDELPASPSAWKPELPPELSWITLKALEKEPARRYASALELADDLRRFLAHEPVLAGPPSTVYRLRKFVRRHAVGVMSAILVLAAILIGTVGLGIGMHQAVQARDDATRKTEDLLSLSAIQDLQDLVARADALWPAHPANLTAYEEWLRDARILVDGRAADPGRGFKARPGLADHRRKLTELEARALPRTAPELAADRASHTRAAELERKRSELTWMSRMLGESPWPAESTVRAEIDAPLAAADPRALNALAWPMIDPDKAVHGNEVRALLLAQAAVQHASDDERPSLRDTLAWALFANGRLDDALAEERKALDEVPEEKREAYRGYVAKVDAAASRWRDAGAKTARARERDALASEVASLETEVSGRRTWTFSNSEDRWWHAQLSKLVSDLEAFTDERAGGLCSPGTSEKHGWGIAKRAEFARTVEASTVSGPDAKRRWDEAIAAIGKSERYRGLALKPQLGLLPIGADPRSGLWEFAHLQTGEPPERGADGSLAPAEETGLVFVLIPGGRFWMGAQKTDPSGPNFDRLARNDEGPVHEVELSPYFLSKYEMTQGQWLRIAGRNPSYYAPGANILGHKHDLRHPVEGVNWRDCMLLMSRLGLTLPSEAQWENGGRAGTSTPWWTGAERESLRGAANIGDRSYARVGGVTAVADDWPDLDDGWGVHAPAGTFAANAFGLHEIHGNVCELCLDGYDAGFYARSRGKDPVCPWADFGERVSRGGGLDYTAAFSRCACRDRNGPETSASSLGLRPARALDP